MNEFKKLFTDLQFYFHFKRRTSEKGVFDFNFELIELDQCILTKRFFYDLTYL